MSGDRLPLSCFIIAQDEEDRIGQTLESVRGVSDDIVVIDSGSRDRTQEISKQAGARVVFNAWQGFGQQKRFGEEQCQHDWVLNLDADEVLTPELISEIKSLFAQGVPAKNGYSIKFLTVYPGRAKPRLLADYHNYVRLYDKSKLRFPDHACHDSIAVDPSQIGQLSGTAFHHSNRSLDHFISKENYYTTLQAATLAAKPQWQLYVRLIFEFPFAFGRYYFLRGHFLGGAVGFSYAVSHAYFRFVRIAKMLEKRRNQE